MNRASEKDFIRLSTAICLGLLLLTSGLGAEPGSSAAGRRLDIAYRTFDGVGKRPQIFLASADGKVRIRIAAPRRWLSAPVWRDRATLIYSTANRGLGVYSAQFVELRITPDGRTVSSWTFETICLDHVTFSRSGRYACRDGYEEPGLHALSPKGIDRVVLRDQGAGDSTRSFPAISPDGHHLAYVDNGFLARRNIDSDMPERLRGSIGIVVSPAWSPDGKLIAFAKTCGGDPNAELDPFQPSCGLWISRSDATHARRILDWGKNPAWSPDGRRLVFDGVQPRREQRAVYTIRTDGTGLTRVSPWAGTAASPYDELGQRWRPR